MPQGANGAAVRTDDTISASSSGAHQQEATLEFGAIATLRKRFGFIRSTSRALDLFFHHSDLHPDLPPEQLCVGLEVQFTPCRDPGSNRLVAKAVQRAASGTVVFHVVSKQQYLGQVLDLPVQLWAAGPASAPSAAAATAAATATATATPLPASAGNAASPRASPLDTAPASNALVGHNAHAGSADTPSQPSCSAAPSPCSHHTPSLESPGIIRYLPEAGRVQHIMFRSCDVAAGGCRGGALQPETLVLFNICTDKRVASNAVRASGKGGVGGGVAPGGSREAPAVEAMDTGAGSVSCVSSAELRAGRSAGEVRSAAGSASGATGCRASHHAANRAVKIMALDPSALQYLDPDMQRQATLLQLLSAIPATNGLPPRKA